MRPLCDRRPSWWQRISVGSVVRLSVASLFCVASTSIANPIAEDCRIVVLELKGQNLQDRERELPLLFTDTVTQEVADVSGCQVVSQEELRELLSLEADRLACGAESISCIAEIGAALGAELVVSGALGRVGDEFQVSTRLLHSRDGQVKARSQRSVTRGEQGIRLAVQNAVRELFDAELLEESPRATEREGSPSKFLFGTGVVTTALGTAALLGGGAVAALADSALADPTQRDKDLMKTSGRIGVVVAASGIALGVIGAALIAIAYLGE
ncbi:MAG: hypothetical protein ACO3JL_05830 [Myxococcota bacterium]